MGGVWRIANVNAIEGLPQVHPGHCDPSRILFVFVVAPTPISRSFVRSFVGSIMKKSNAGINKMETHFGDG